MTELEASVQFAALLSSQSVVTLGNWHRIGLCRDDTNRVLYVDDVEVAKDAQTSLASSNNGLYIGAGKGLESRKFWSGLIDDVRIRSAPLRTGSTTG